jgi:hypothetical protein
MSTRISVKVAAGLLGKSPAWVRALIADERLPAVQERDDRNLPVWWIDPADLDRVRDLPMGRPRKRGDGPPDHRGGSE